MKKPNRFEAFLVIAIVVLIIGCGIIGTNQNSVNAQQKVKPQTSAPPSPQDVHAEICYYSATVYYTDIPDREELMRTELGCENFRHAYQGNGLFYVYGTKLVFGN